MESLDTAAYVQLAANVLTSLSVLGAFVAFSINLRHMQRARQEQLYTDIDDVFTDFQKTILDKAHLDVAWVPLASPPILSDAEQAQQAIIFELATSMFERAYLLYRDAPRKVKGSQWPGWLDYIKGYCRRDSYRTWWRTSYHMLEAKSVGGYSQTYDADFERFMNRLFSDIEREQSRR